MSATERRPGRGDLGVAQPVRRQRHQAVRGRRPQAGRRGRGALEAELGRSSRRAAATPGRCAAPTGAASAASPPARAASTGLRRPRWPRSLDGRRLDGPHARWSTAPTARRRPSPPACCRARGRPSTCIHAEPDGTNINDGCGSTHPERPAGGGRRAGRRRRAGLRRRRRPGARRSTPPATLVDGDQIIAICAIDRHDRGLLPATRVVVTVMTNLGFRLAMDSAGINVVETAGRRPLRARGARRRRLRPRRRAVRPRDLPRPGHHRRRPAHRAAAARRRAPVRAARWPTWPPRR